MAASLNAILTKSPVPSVVGLPPTIPEDVCQPNSFADDLLRYTPVATLILDAALQIRQVSDSYLRVSGANNRNHVVGHYAPNIFHQTVTFPAHASAREALQIAQDTGSVQQVQHLTNDNRAWTIRAVPVVRHGSLRYFQMEFTDTTEQRRQQLELEERLYTNECYRALVETVKDYAIFMLDPDGNVATWNAGAQAFKGYKPSEIIGRHFSNFYSEDDRRAGKPERELVDALRDGRCEDEGWRYRSDGSRFWANVVITTIYKDGAHLGFSKVTRDLTERRKSERKLISAYEEASKLKSE